MSATLGRLSENPLVKTILALPGLHLLLVYPASRRVKNFFKGDPKVQKQHDRYLILID